MYEHNILERESISDIRYSFSFLFPAISKVLTNSLDHERNLSVKKSWSYTGPSYTYLLSFEVPRSRDLKKKSKFPLSSDILLLKSN